MQVSRERVGLGHYCLFLIVSLLCGSCVSRVEVEMDIWQQDGLPQALCDANPQLRNYGIYRVIECTRIPSDKQPNYPRCARFYACQKNGAPADCITNPPQSEYEEFIPYCNSNVKQYLSMHRDDVNKWLDKLTQPTNGKK